MKRENASSQPLTQGLTSDKWFGSIVTALVLTVTVKRDTVTTSGPLWEAAAGAAVL